MENRERIAHALAPIEKLSTFEAITQDLFSSIAVLRNIENRLLRSESIDLTAQQLEDIRTHAILTAINVFKELSLDTKIPYLHELTAATLFTSFFFALGSSSTRYDIHRSNLETYVSHIGSQASGKDLLSKIFNPIFYEFIIGETLRQLDPRDAEAFNEFLDGARDLDTLEVPFDAVGLATFQICAEATSLQRLLIELGVAEQVAELAMLLTFERSYLETQPELKHVPKVFDPPYIPWALLFNFNQIAGELCLILTEKYHPRLFHKLQMQASRGAPYIDNPLLIQTLFALTREIQPYCRELAERNSDFAFNEGNRYPKSLEYMAKHPEETEVRSFDDIPLANGDLPIPLLLHNILIPALRYLDYHYSRVSQLIPIPQLLIDIYRDLDIILFPKTVATVLNEIWRTVTGLTGKVEWREVLKKLDEVISTETLKIVALSNIFWSEYVRRHRETLVRQGIIPPGYDNSQDMLTTLADRGLKGSRPTAQKVTGEGRPYYDLPRPPLTRFQAIQISRDNTDKDWRRGFKGIHTSDLYSVSVSLNGDIGLHNNFGQTAMWIAPWLQYLNGITHLVYPDLTHLIRKDFQFLQVILVPPYTGENDNTAIAVCPPFELRVFPAAYLKDIRSTHVGYKFASQLFFTRTPFIVHQLTASSQIELTRPAGTIATVTGTLRHLNEISEVLRTEQFDIIVDTQHAVYPQRGTRFMPTFLNALMMKPDLALILLKMNPPLGVMNSTPNREPNYNWTPQRFMEDSIRWRQNMRKTASGVFSRVFTKRSATEEEKEQLVRILSARAKIQAANRLPPSGKIFIFRHLEELNYTSTEIIAATLAAVGVFTNNDLGRLIAMGTFNIESLSAIKYNFVQMFKLFIQGHANLNFFKQMIKVPELGAYLHHIREQTRF